MKPSACALLKIGAGHYPKQHPAQSDCGLSFQLPTANSFFCFLPWFTSYGVSLLSVVAGPPAPRKKNNGGFGGVVSLDAAPCGIILAPFSAKLFRPSTPHVSRLSPNRHLVQRAGLAVGLRQSAVTFCEQPLQTTLPPAPVGRMAVR